MNVYDFNSLLIIITVISITSGFLFEIVDEALVKIRVGKLKDELAERDPKRRG